MRCLYLTPDNAALPQSANNGHYLGKALANSAIEVDFHTLRSLTNYEKIRLGSEKLLYKAIGRDFKVLGDYRFLTRRLQDMAARRDLFFYDLLFSNGGTNFAGYRGEVPFAFYTDAPIAALYAMGQYMDRWPKRSIEKLIEIDRQAVERADVVIYHSEWARREAISAYSVSPSKIKVVAPGANIPRIPLESARIDEPSGKGCNLLFFGRDWKRKGGPRAVSITRQLRGLGVDAVLHVCGPNRSSDFLSMAPSVVWHPPIQKQNDADIGRLSSLMGDADFLLLPTLGDTSASAIREACAFGVPSVVTAIGGLPEMVLDGESGILIREDDDDESIAQRILTNFGNDRSRVQWRRSARREYESRMNWDVAGALIAQALSSKHRDKDGGGVIQ